VGLKVYSDSKDGRDAGEIAGLPSCGVKATKDDEALIDLDADVVCHMPVDPGLADPGQPGSRANDQLKMICRLLTSGKNVVSTSVLSFQNPKALSSEANEKLEKACRAGGTSFQCVGIHPGHMDVNALLPFTAFSESIESIHVSEVINYAEYNQPQMLFDGMGFGKTLEELAKRGPVGMGRQKKWRLEDSLAPIIHLIGEALGFAVDEVRSVPHDIALAHKDFDIPAGHIAKDTLAALHFGSQGIVGGVPRVTIEWFTRIHSDVAPDWPSVGERGDGYIVTIQGSPSLRMEVEFTGGKGLTPMEEACQATAMVAINSIPLLCEAEPGVKTLLNLPPLVGTRTLRASA